MKMLLLLFSLLLTVSRMPKVSSANSEAIVIEASGEVNSFVEIDDHDGNEIHETVPPVPDDESHNDKDNNDVDGDGDHEHVYYEYMDVDYFPYYPEEFEGDGRPENVCGDSKVDKDRDDCIVEGQFILSDFVVAGSNLAGYGVLHPKFQLFDDFNIAMFLRGDESWKDLLNIRRTLQRPSLSWYVDKVARKRWLQEKGYPQPKVYWMKYKSEIGGSTKEEQSVEIAKNLPTEHGFCAKPTHMSMTMGT
jgi:hypothetical protein